MAKDYSDYLAVLVLNEQQLVSYRSLSRALKVHSNLAKQMLYEFHRKQNAKKPGSVHATYLVVGTSQTSGSTPNGVHSQQGDGDTVMQSSPPLPGSSAPLSQIDHAESRVHAKTVLLVREEHLDAARARFDAITGIHIYSLQANGISDLQTLKECNRTVAATYASEDPLQDWKAYGTIQNPNAKRRTTKGRPPPVAAAASLPKAEPKANPPAPTIQQSEKPAEKTKEKPKEKASTKPAATKSQASSIFKSFAKTKPPKPKPEDEPMADFSDEGEPEETALPDVSDSEKAPTGKSKQEREAELAAMMDEEDEPMEDANPVAEEAELEDSKSYYIDEPAPKVVEEPQETVTTTNGQRRGRRKVMKKKTVKDEDGYLVTREEAVWESFSEDEPPVKKAKATPAAPPGKKAGGKVGQGNIMSFFGKK